MIELLKKYLDDQCTPDELQKVLPYIETPRGRQELEKLLEENWERYMPDIPAENLAGDWYERVDARVKKKPGKLITLYRGSGFRYLAAACVLLAVLGFFFLNREKPATGMDKQPMLVEKVNPKGRRSIITLPDSTIIYLGAESRISYQRGLLGSRREVTLTGEAFFEVSRHAERPFLVNTGDLRTEVLGTSFRIGAFKGRLTTVAVATGKVSVSRLTAGSSETLAVLTPGKQLSWDPGNRKADTGPAMLDAVLDLKNSQLVFHEARLDDIIPRLERWYNTTITCKDIQPGTYTLSQRIDGKKSLNNALDAIMAATGLSYHVHENQIMMYKK